MCDYHVFETDDRSGRTREHNCGRAEECSVCNNCLRHCPGHNNIVTPVVNDDNRIVGFEPTGTMWHSFSPGDRESAAAGTVRIA